MTRTDGPQQAGDQVGPQKPARGFSWRALVLGAILSGVISVVSPWASLLYKGSELTSNAIPLLAVTLLFALVAGVVPVLRAVWPRAAPSRGELIAVYVMMLTAAVVPTKGLMGSFLGVITGPSYYATPGNNWKDLFLINIHRWVAPANSEAIQFLYEGLPRGMGIPWQAWAIPLVTWGVFLLAFYWTLFCVGALLRGQWLDNERLIFPLTKLPLAMTEGVDEQSGTGVGLFRSPMMWAGFSIPAILHSWNSLHFYHEAVARVANSTSLQLLHGEVSIPIHLNLPVVGLGYLMQLNVTFSVWFFYLLTVVQRWVFARIGLQIGGSDVWNSGLTPATIMHEQAGAMFALIVFALWTGRRHLRDFVIRARRAEPARPEEPLSPRAALVGLAGGVLVCVGWLMMTGMSAYVAVLLVVGALLVFVGLARIVGEAGMPSCQTPMVPQAFIMRGIGAQTLGLRNMTGLGMSTVWMGETSANMMNAVIHSFKLVLSSGTMARRLLPAMGIAILVALAGSLSVTMYLAYTHGGINLEQWYFGGAPRWPYEYAASLVNNPERSFAPRLTFTAIGGGIMGLLLFLRQRFLWWPLHPIGFPIAATFPVHNYNWSSLFLAWLLKGVVMHYGGVKAYRRLMPLFLGLILGHFATATVWVFIDGYHGVVGNVIFFY